ncbi:MAG: DNA polymerase III subunit delta' [Arcanobacterium sp.]|nr:DNA polymerase III subunit delta' [Arcanobacterium sp.]
MSVFQDLVSQEAAKSEILRAAAAARVLRANENSNHPVLNDAHSNELNTSAMTHAWLFTGPPGSGRSLAARAFAACLQCEEEHLGGGECSECKAVMADNHPDVDVVTTDLVTISVEQVRQLVARSYLAPSSGAWRVFIIEDADRIIARTTNVLLKAIEEPAPRTIWILCTTAVADVLPTIRSRCRNINLVTPNPSAVAELLVRRDGVDLETAKVAALASQSHIGVARALAHDTEARILRNRSLDVFLSIRGVGDAVIAAKALIDANYMLGREAQSSKKKHVDTEEAAEALRIKKMEALGLDPNAKIPTGLRSQINEDADNEKRRQTRRNLDRLDRELIYLVSFFRDVLVRQLGSEVDLVNLDYESQINRWASSLSVNASLEALDQLSLARTRLQQNVAPALVFEAALVGLPRP